MIKEIGPNRRGLCRGTVLRSAFFVVNFWQWLRPEILNWLPVSNPKNDGVSNSWDDDIPIFFGKS
jgi:hypothetical protein